MIRGIVLVVGALVVLYVGFALGQQYEGNPEQRRALRLFVVAIAALTAALAWSLTVR